MGQLPSGISDTGPLLGPPALNRSLGGSGLGDADPLLGGDASVVGGGVLGGGLMVGGGEVRVVEGGLVVGGGVVIVVEGGLPPPTTTGVSSLAGSS